MSEESLKCVLTGLKRANDKNTHFLSVRLFGEISKAAAVIAIRGGQRERPVRSPSRKFKGPQPFWVRAST